jgi:hypothetical protein
MAVRDRLRKGATRYLEPGEQIQAVFYAKRPTMQGCCARSGHSVNGGYGVGGSSLTGWRPDLSTPATAPPGAGQCR